jgi:HlyD family secretion protein
LPGTSADVEVILKTLSEVLRIPTNALMQDDQVFVVVDGEIVERKVETGLRNWDFVEVTSGLQEGAQVVTSLDQEEVGAGSRVEIIENDEEP